MNVLETTSKLRMSRVAARRGLRLPVGGVARSVLVLALAAGLWAAGGSRAWAQTYYQPNCPAGQIRAYSGGGGCVSPQQSPSLSGYGLPYQTTNLPQAGLNGAPAIQRCNGTPVPFGQPCPGTVIPAATTLGQTAASGHSSNNPSGISISLPPSTTGSSVNATGAPPASYMPLATAASTAGGAGASTVTAASSGSAASPPTAALTPPANPTAALQGLLGDWYNGWIGYAATSLNWSDAQTAQVATYLASVAPCLANQKDACQAFIYQQLQVWLNAPAAPSTSGS
jgi:hypothetical protein